MAGQEAIRPPQQTPTRFSFSGNKVNLCNNANKLSQNPGPRWGHASVVVDSNVYMIGGLGDATTREMCVFNLGMLNVLECKP